MADIPHFFKKLQDDIALEDKYTGNKTWFHSPLKINRIHTDDYFKNYEMVSYPIDKLIEWNDLDNPNVLRNHPEFWSKTKDEDDIDPTSFVYRKDKDVGDRDIIYGTIKSDGKVRLSDGRHRIRALKNGGYTHAYIPVIDDRIFGLNTEYKDWDDTVRKQYQSKNPNHMMEMIHAINMGLLPYDKETNQMIKKIFRGRMEYLKWMENIRRR